METGALPEIWCCGKARGERISFMDLYATSNAAAAPKIEQPHGLSSGERLAVLLLSHRTLGYAPSSPLASRPPELSAPVPNYEMGS